MEKVLRFGRKGKLSPRFIVGPVEYQLELPRKLDCIHDVFHVSMLRRYQFDPSHIVPIEEIEVIPNLSFEEEPMQILNRENHYTEEATWELEDMICQQYPHLFKSGKF
ncbi:Chromo domain-containing protein [Gossypium australe]|uniref:Chromo domain-containing protein n=1 Tax=Gossypium australe TaxID=47621 RepID=A0A5B6X1V5_9ROSI|nr:Chromo domain-containing protein [Gossypium australe]